MLWFVQSTRLFAAYYNPRFVLDSRETMVWIQTETRSYGMLNGTSQRWAKVSWTYVEAWFSASNALTASIGKACQLLSCWQLIFALAAVGARCANDGAKLSFGGKTISCFSPSGREKKKWEQLGNRADTYSQKLPLSQQRCQWDSSCMCLLGVHTKFIFC